MHADAAGPRALAMLDRLLAERPHRSGHDFSETTRCLTAYRDELIAQVRAGHLERRLLEEINAVLSVVVGGHFPLGPVPWTHIEQARDRLAGLLRALRQP